MKTGLLRQGSGLEGSRNDRETVEENTELSHYRIVSKIGAGGMAGFFELLAMSG